MAEDDYESRVLYRNEFRKTGRPTSFIESIRGMCAFLDIEVKFIDWMYLVSILQYFSLIVSYEGKECQLYLVV